MSKNMPVEDAMEIIADEAMAIGPPFDNNPMALAGKALRDEIERLRALTTPVKCGERLPEEVGLCLIWTPPYQTQFGQLGNRWDTRRWEGDGWALGGTEMSHWLPMPEAPETPND